MVTMVIEGTSIVMWLNETELGVMYEDEEIGAGEVYPYVQFNEKND